MTPKERASLAEQLLANPLFNATFDALEKSAVEAMIYAQTDDERARGAMRVLVVRDFRRDCQACLRDTTSQRVAPA